jgi:hypothetical protein
MKLENQVTNLEISKRLKELGIPQCSYFKWTDWHNGVLNFGQPSENFRGEWHVVTTPVWLDETVVSAFTVAELGEMLPWTFIAKRASKFPETEMFLMMSKDDSMGQKSFSIWYEGMYDDGEEFKWESIIEQNEAEARGKMLIYLIENGLLKV